MRPQRCSIARRGRIASAHYSMAVMLFLLCSALLAQTPVSPLSAVHFRVPKKWKAVNDTLFVLRNEPKEIAYWTRALKGGHMPWRSNPGMVATACCVEFGICAEQRLDSLSLQMVKDPAAGRFSITVDSTTYVVHTLKTTYAVVANRLEISRRPGAVR
jgi:hypothetical protein